MSAVRALEALADGRSTRALERMLHEVATWLASLRARHASRVPFERDVVVSVSDTGVTAAYPTGTVQTIDWASVARIVVETNNSGPWGVDVWWCLEGSRASCSFPQGATGEASALAEIHHRFPGFEVLGMNSTGNARFVCWEQGHAL